MPWILVARDGERTVHFDLAEGENVVGSADGCAIRLGHPTISRRHARIWIDKDNAEAEDLGSTNGTRLVDKELVGRSQVPAGKRLVFGSVEAWLEQVNADDAEVAMTFADMNAEDETEPVPIFRTTAITGSLRWFVLERLPLVVNHLEDGADAVRMAQTVGEALFAALPCDLLEIQLGDGVVFTAGDVLPEPSELAAEAGPAKLRIHFRHEMQARGYKSLVTTGARLVALASEGRSASAAAPARSSRPLPPLPEPASLDPEVRRLYADAARVAQGDINVLIRGEPGTGKTVLARYLHAASPAAGDPLVTLHCAAMPRELLENELFGTDGEDEDDRRPGRFEEADGGLLFLDEIGDLALETQAKILRVLQQDEVYRRGGQTPRPARVRVVATTNRDLERLLDTGAFRADLYQRLVDWPVELPPLRRRREDVPNLAAHFLKEAAARHDRHVAGISRGALQALSAYHWPGNVRQLKREMERVALFLEDRELLQSRHLQAAIFDTRGGGEGAAGDLKTRLENCERAILRDAIAAAEGNMSAVARNLGIGRSTLYRRLKELGIDVES